MDDDMNEILIKARELYIDTGKTLIIDNPKDDFEEAYNDGIRTALLAGYMEGSTDAVLHDTSSLIEHVIAFDALMNKYQGKDDHDK